MTDIFDKFLNGEIEQITEEDLVGLDPERRALFEELAASVVVEREAKELRDAANADLTNCMILLNEAKAHLNKVRPPQSAYQAQRQWIETQAREAARRRGKTDETL